MTARKRIAFIAVAALAVAMVATAIVINRPNLDSNVAAVVDGHPVSVREFTTFSAANSLPLTSEAHIAKAITAVTSYKVMQVAALTRGLPVSLAYSDLLETMASRNAANAKSMKNHRAIYGVATYSAETFLSHQQSTLKHALQTDLVAKQVIAPTAAQLAAYYRDHKTDYAKNQDTVSLEFIRFEATAAGNAELQSVFTRLETGVPFATILAGYQAAPPATLIDLGPIELSQDTAYSLSKYDNGIFTVGNRLKVNGAQVVQNDVAGGLLVVHCSARESAGYQSAPAVSDETKQRYDDAAFAKYLAARASAATVVVNNRLDGLIGQ